MKPASSIESWSNDNVDQATNAKEFALYYREEVEKDIKGCGAFCPVSYYYEKWIRTKEIQVKKVLGSEAIEMLATLPIIKIGGGYGEQPNAFVTLSEDKKRVEIFPVGGGWLGFNIQSTQGDVAPFAD